MSAGFPDDVRNMGLCRSHGGNTGSNPVGDANKFNMFNASAAAREGCVRKKYGKDVPGRARESSNPSAALWDASSPHRGATHLLRPPKKFGGLGRLDSTGQGRGFARLAVEHILAKVGDAPKRAIR